jgi:hypothetical protein
MERTCTYASSDIVVLTGLEAVRRRPGMYIGDVQDGSGLHHMLWELVANSLDEHLGGHARRIRVSVEADWAEVEDDGRGIPVDPLPEREMSALEFVLTTLHAGPTLDGHLPHVHVSPQGFGVGLPAVNALADPLEVEIRRQGFSWKQHYARGIPLATLERGPRTYRTGTRIRFLSLLRVDAEHRHVPAFLVAHDEPPMGGVEREVPRHLARAAPSSMTLRRKVVLSRAMRRATATPLSRRNARAAPPSARCSLQSRTLSWPEGVPVRARDPLGKLVAGGTPASLLRRDPLPTRWAWP